MQFALLGVGFTYIINQAKGMIMYNVMIVGAGKIGSLIACLLADSGDYQVHLADLHFEGSDIARVLQAMPDIKKVSLDIKDQKAAKDYILANNIIAILSSLPYFLNIYVAKIAKLTKAHYFDLTEDTEVAKAIKTLAAGENMAFVPQCGLAPGFISIIANNIISEFDHCIEAKLRVGALPQFSSNALNYALTWSTDGLINEYGNPCYGIENGREIEFRPLEGLEKIQIDGCEYEAFNTSGGLGSLAELHLTKIENLNYKTIRYPGHCEKMRLLMMDLKLNANRETLKQILENSLPKTYQDIVIVYVAVNGVINKEFIEKTYMKKIYPQEINGLSWSAIQVSTAASACAVVDLILEEADNYHGFIQQENFQTSKMLANRFGSYYA